MSELEYLQKNFQNLVEEGGEDFKQNVVGDSKEFINTRIAIYYDGYRLRLAGVLMADYPGLHTLMGDEQFETLCQKYIKAYPSDHFSARYFGRFMLPFLSTVSPYKEQPMLADMASFEWMVGEVLDAEDADLFSLEQLQDISPARWPTLTISLHPSYREAPLTWNAPKFWTEVKAEKNPDLPTKYSEPVNWILWRKGVEVYFRSLKKDEAWVLQAVLEGHNFSEICEGLCEWVEVEEVAARVVGFLQNWLLDEMITSVD